MVDVAGETRRARGAAWPGLAVLAVFYFVQGLPFGFQAMALPVFLRREGVATSVITAAGLLALPWGLKILWAPFVDSRYAPRLGRRRSWILPMQLAMAVSCALAAFVAEGRGISDALPVFLVAVLAMNLCAAVMDVAVDGLAIELLAERHLGYGNAIQVAGYKLGMLAGGGLVLVVAGSVRASGALLGMGALALAGAVVAVFYREPAPGVRRDEAPPTRVREVVALLRAALAERSALLVLVFIGTYKAGEAMADALFRVFLVDAGFSDREIGLWVSTYGMVASLLGSLLGGALASRARTIVRAVGIAAALRALGIATELYAVAFPSSASVIVATLAQHCFGGMLTAAMFAFMMSRVDRRIGATHYTLLATVELLGKGPTGWLSGFLQERMGYLPVYALALALSVAFLGLLRPIARHGRPGEAAGALG